MKNLIKKWFIAVLVIMNCASFKAMAQFCRNDLSFNPGTGVSGSSTTRVLTSAIQSDGKIIIGGEFNSYNGTARNNIARLNADGSIDLTFNPGTGANEQVYTIAIQSDGKIIIGGEFYSYNGTARNAIARLNADGSLDATFNPVGSGPSSAVYTTAIQSDGKIIIGGAFTFYNGTAINRIARLNADGTLDATFNTGTGADNTVRTTAIQSDGKIIIGGHFLSYNGTVTNSLVRLNADGSLDGTFSSGANGTHIITAMQSDGKIMIGGYFNYANGRSYLLARLNSDGSLDGTFNTGTGPDFNLETIAIQNDGKIIIGGRFLYYNGAPVNCITRLNTDGSLDGTFNPGGAGASAYVYTTAIQSDGKIIIAGVFTSFTGAARNKIARINSDNIPAPTISGSTQICPGGSVTLTASSGAAYLWNTGATTQSITVSTPGNYSVIVDNCSSSAATVSYKPVPVITASGYTNLCPGQSIVLSATTGSSYLWSTGETTKDITVSAAGNYTVAVTDADGCTQSSAATTVTVQALATPGTSKTGTVILNPCFGGEFLSVTGYPNGQGYTFAWYKTGLVNPVSTAYNIFITSPGDYYVVVSRSGCSSSPPSATVHVTDEHVFGDNTWYVYLWQNVNYNENSPFYEFQGYYTEPLLSFDTRNRWNEFDAPSFSADNYVGCQYDADYFLFSAKRKGFPCGHYKINIPGHNDWAELWVNGVKVWEHIGAGDSHANVWEGDLGPNSTIEYKVTEISGAAYGVIQLDLLSPAVQTYYLDADDDGYGDAANSIVDCSTHPGYVLNNTDCNDNNAEVWRSASLYIDADGDGYTVGSATVCYGATVPSGYRATTLGSDCNDGNAAVHAMGNFYVDADGDSYGTGSLQSICYSGSGTPGGYSTNNTDCNDNNAAIWRSGLLYTDADGDGNTVGSAVSVCYGANVPTGYSATSLGTDCNDNNAGVQQPIRYYQDADRDGYGVDNNKSVLLCNSTAPAGYSPYNTDCNDRNAAINPGAAELCDGIDNNCNGMMDENCPQSTISINDMSIAEGNTGKKTMTFTVTLSQSSTKVITVNYTTSNVTATAPSDYTAKSGTVTFKAGALTQSIDISIVPDKTAEPNETFNVILTNPTNATISKATGTGTIVNDDGAATKVFSSNEVQNEIAVNESLVTIAPNPVSNILRVTLSGYSGTVSIQLINVQGTVLKQERFNIGNLKYAQRQMNITAIASGSYLLVVTDEKGNRKTKKVIVAH